MHDFTGESVLVFGGGPVGARKARRFAAEADVVVVSPDFADRDFGGAQRIRDAPDPEGVRDYIERLDPALVVAATDDETVNEAAVTAARERGALVNHADDHGSQPVGTVSVPATIRDDPVTVAIATGGAAPALSRHLREQFEEEFAGSGDMATILQAIREDLQTRDVAPETRRQAVRDVVRAPAVWKALDTGRFKAKHEAAAIVSDRLGESS